MKAAFKYLISDIKRGENIDIYITLCLSLVLAILGVTGIIQATILSAGILATLSVLAYSMLATRRTLSEFSHNITSLQPVEDIPLKDRSAYGSFRDRIERVSTIWLVGPSLVNVWAPNNDLIFEKVRKGGEIRVLIFNPESTHLPITAEQVRVRPDRLKLDIIKTLEVCKELAHDGLGAGKFEVRLTEMLPGYSMVICNPSKPDGQMIVEYLGYRSYLNERPHIELDASRNRQWFEYYRNQYDELWKSSAPCKLDDLLT